MRAQLTSKRTGAEEVSAVTADGLLLAHVGEDGAWEAVRSLRAAMRRLSRLGRPHATSITAIAEDGREVAAQDPEAEVIALGYRVVDEDRSEATTS